MYSYFTLVYIRCMHFFFWMLSNTYSHSSFIIRIVTINNMHYHSKYNVQYIAAYRRRVKIFTEKASLRKIFYWGKSIEIVFKIKIKCMIKIKIFFGGGGFQASAQPSDDPSRLWDSIAFFSTLSASAIRLS